MIMKDPRIVCTGPVDKVAVDLLQPFGNVVVAPDHSHESLLSMLDGTIALLVRGEGKINAEIIGAAADLKVIARTGAKVKYLVGTMIEIPRAALTADEIAETAEFFSFGTNDLTQMTFGYSRDDIGTFLPDYLGEKILPSDPFQHLDLPEDRGSLVPGT